MKLSLECIIYLMNSLLQTVITIFICEILLTFTWKCISLRWLRCHLVNVESQIRENLLLLLLTFNGLVPYAVQKNCFFLCRAKYLIFETFNAVNDNNSNRERSDMCTQLYPSCALAVRLWSIERIRKLVDYAPKLNIGIHRAAVRHIIEQPCISTLCVYPLGIWQICCIYAE